MRLDRIRMLREHIAWLDESKFFMVACLHHSGGISPRTHPTYKDMPIHKVMDDPHVSGDLAAWVIYLFDPFIELSKVVSFSTSAEALLELSTDHFRPLNGASSKIGLPTCDKNEALARLDAFLAMYPIDYLAITRELSGG